jgi:hypothetical protein
MQKNIHHDKVENKKQFMIIVTSFLNILFTKKTKKHLSHVLKCKNEYCN